MKCHAAQAIHTWCTGIATGVTVATIFGWLPAIAAFLASIWYVIIIIEKVIDKPVHRWFRQ